MLTLFIVFGVIFAIIGYAFVTYHVINIMDEAGCKGSFIEWITVLVPIINLIMLIRNWSLLDRDTWKEQFETMSDKMKNERERHAKAKERSAKIARELLND